MEGYGLLRLEKNDQPAKVPCTKAMNPKSKNGRENNPRSAAGHGAFKHIASPATFSAVLTAFGLEKKAYERTKAYVLSRVKIRKSMPERPTVRSVPCLRYSNGVEATPPRSM